MKKRAAGYTLVELVVVIAIFSVVMTLISVSFNRIVASSGRIVKASETDIGGLIGLELFRIDLGFAGFGLPWSVPSGVSYSEAESRVVDGNADTNAVLFNDAPGQPPRAFALADKKGMNLSDYLVLKGTALGMTSTSRCWSYLNYSSTGAVMKTAKSEVELTSGRGERVIVISSGVRGNEPFRDLVTNGNSYAISFDNRLPEAFQPNKKESSYLVFGLAPSPKDSEDKISFPFNRADYYLGVPEDHARRRSDPSYSICAPGTGMLYRGMVSQKGNLKPWPILDCVADLQVEFLNDSGAVTDIGKEYSAQQIRDEVKGVRVYIMAQQGKKDSNFSYSVRDPDRAWEVGHNKPWTQAQLAATFGPDWLHYRWKLYTIAVETKNLQ